VSLKAVLFDLDGVIVNTAKYHYIAWKELADKLGIYFDEDINERLKGVSRMASLEIILERAEKKYSGIKKEAFADEKNSRYVAMVKQLTPSEILPGVLDFLNELNAAGIRCAVCSASKSAGMIIDLLELNDYFDAVFGGADVTKPKPDPEIFILAQTRFGLAPEECLVIEDAFAGIEAAQTAGMRTMGIGDEKILTNADVVYRDMTCFSLADVYEFFN